MRERWISLLGGGAITLYGLTRRTPLNLVLALVGGEMLYRGLTGHSHVYQALGVNTAGEHPSPSLSTPLSGPIQVEKAVTINRSADHLYHFWRNFENLPCFMQHLESVKTMPDGRTHWVAKAPLGSTVEWDAEITEERENELIAWRALENAEVYNTGSVRFKEAPGGRGTEVKVQLEYTPPGGVLGATFAKLFGEEPAQQVAGDLRRFKQMMEAGEIATVEGQTSGRARQTDDERIPDEAEHVGQPKSVVRKASEDSFPASDPPAWTGGLEDEESREVGA
jgi:uncharacterized membrane protein